MPIPCSPPAGLNAALGTVDPEDSWQQHFADTMREGYHLSDPRVVEIMTSEAPAAINELADWGCPFARTSDGKLDQRYFGAHTRSAAGLRNTSGSTSSSSSSRSIEASAV